MLKGFSPLYQTEQIQQLTRAVSQRRGPVCLYGLTSTSQKALYIALLAAVEKRPFLLITYGHSQAQKLLDDLLGLLPGYKIGFFPVNEGAFYDVVGASDELTDQRLQVLLDLQFGNLQGVITTIEALMLPVLPPNVLAEQIHTFHIGDRVNIQEFMNTLVLQGYERTATVDTPGTFARRGGILDLFAPMDPLPVRIEFFDDEIDSIRLFDPVNQRSYDPIQEYRLSPGSEMVLTSEAKRVGLKALENDFTDSVKRLRMGENPSTAEELEQRFRELLARLEEGRFDESWIPYLPYFYPDRKTLWDYFKQAPLLWLDEPSRMQETAEHRHREVLDYCIQGFARGEMLRGRQKHCIAFNDLIPLLQHEDQVSLTMILRRPVWLRPVEVIDNPVKSLPLFRGSLPVLMEEFTRWRQHHYRILILAEEEERARQIQDLLREYQIEPLIDNEEEDASGSVPRIRLGYISEGMEMTSGRFVLLPDSSFFSKAKKRRFKSSSESRKLRTYRELKPGDLVVHIHHGIGRYIGVNSMVLEGLQKDYLHIQYAGEDKLYVPIDQIGYIQKYIGSGEDKTTRLTSLNSTEWSRTTGKVKKAVEDMAEDLLALYAQRQSQLGYAFSRDTAWQVEMEDDFMYEETEDQLRCIADIKQDMEQPQPMERLLCGDVGFGKTEVAIRAAFKAVTDGKQVAVLVPTTVLAQQHFSTFRERLANFPVNIALMSRYRSSKENEQTVHKLKNKQIDIVIGTHRLLSKDVEFADLGLLIIDEEQRFGVAHKEKLKKMKTNVDVLMLSATPIPRTLHMSLVGIRDMSMIETPPENRFPVQTYVMEWNPELVREAIQRELERQGQVFVVHNRIAALPILADQLEQLVPQGRFVIAHGQMPEGKLAETMSDFLSGEYDVLISTTIIEAGIDMPNVNTLIVCDADRYGLSQLHQLRGRIGRSSRIGYAYFMYTRDKQLTEISEKRLVALREFCQLGEGYKIALRDLEMRGVGNLLGAEQHGNVAAVGFELYSLMLKEAIEKLKGVVPVKKVETVLEISVDAFIPSDYIADVGHKVDFYRRIQQADLNELTEIQDELLDRFGDIPLQVRNLLQIAQLRLKASACGIKQISQKPGEVIAIKIDGVTYTLNNAALLVMAMEGRLRHQAGKSTPFLLDVSGLSTSAMLQQIEIFVAGFQRIAKS